MAEERDITWYRSEDLILGFCGPAGIEGVYRFWLDHSDEWQFCPPQTGNWDYYHQMVFRQCRADDCEFGDIVDKVPSLPAEFPPPAQYHVKEPSEAPVRPSDDLLEKIRAAPDGRLPVYVVLGEDPYETSFGDGVFRDFNSAHLDEEAARAHIGQLLGRPPRMTIESDDPPDTRSLHEIHYIRKVYLTLSGGTLALDTEDCDLSQYDHFTQNQIVRDLNHPERLRSLWQTVLGVLGRRRVPGR